MCKTEACCCLKLFQFKSSCYYGGDGLCYMSEGNKGNFFGGSSTKECDHDCDQALIKRSCIEYRVYMY